CALPILTARHGNAGYLIFSPTRAEAELAGLASELLEAAHESRFGAQASAGGLACAVCAFDASITEPAQALAADPNSITQRLAVALASGSLGLAFQPILPIRGAAEPQYQALLRLRADGQ